MTARYVEAVGRPDRAHAAFARLRPLLERGAANRRELGVYLVSACAAVRDVACAKEALEQLGYDRAPEPWSPLEHFELHAEVAAAQGDTEGAIRHARAAPQPRCPNCFELIVASAFLGASEPDSAVAAYERYLASPSTASIYRAWQHGAIHERLAEHHASRGDGYNAAQHYSRVIELWERADPELQPKVEAARRGLERLRAD